MLDSGNSLLESRIRSYSRAFTATLKTAIGAEMVDEQGKTYLDFLSGCGSLNYGHNHPDLKAVLLDYISENSVAMSMDMHTSARSHFLDVFSRYILQPRTLDYKVQFPGPTGANAVEAAIKLARKVTGRSNVIAFTNGFHGCSLGALALTGNSHHRSTSTPLLTNVMRAPYDGYFGEDVDTADFLEQLLSDPSSGFDRPAAIIMETTQGEGGLGTASRDWAQKIARICKKHGALLIVDDIQAGCGRSSDFFSFEALGIVPDLVCLAKAISGYGLPMSLLLIKPDHDVWEPGEHNGTFRGNNLAFVTAAKAIECFWASDEFANMLKAKADTLDTHLMRLHHKTGFQVKGRGLFRGVELGDPEIAGKLQSRCYRAGLIVETCGPRDTVLKLLPPLTVTVDEIARAFTIILTKLDELMQPQRA